MGQEKPIARCGSEAQGLVRATSQASIIVVQGGRGFSAHMSLSAWSLRRSYKCLSLDGPTPPQ